MHDERLPLRWGRICRDIRLGLHYGYPPCCVLAFALDPHALCSFRRGVVDLGHRPNGDQHRYVPCRLHQLHPAWRPSSWKTDPRLVAARRVAP